MVILNRQERPQKNRETRVFPEAAHVNQRGRSEFPIICHGVANFSFSKGEYCGAMARQPHLRTIVGELLADSVTRPLPSPTARRVPGTIRFPGKVTAVVGVRRAGKTTFLHQIRSEVARRSTPIERLPCVSFEDERLADMRSADLGTMIEEYGRQFPDSNRDNNRRLDFRRDPSD